jgi:Cu/Ag efflux protein CusF
MSSTVYSQTDQMTEGLIRKIDKENSKVTIKHEEIKSLDMPPMTMVFQVSNQSLLDKIKVGETVKFTVIQQGEKLVITDIKPAQ